LRLSRHDGAGLQLYAYRHRLGRLRRRQSAVGDAANRVILLEAGERDSDLLLRAVEATGWRLHIVREFLADLGTRRDIGVEVLERVRQVDPATTGAKGSYSGYQLRNHFDVDH
jgi:hypothetical protein